MISIRKSTFCVLFLSVIYLFTSCGGTNHLNMKDAPGGVYQISSAINLKGQTVVLPKDGVLQFKKGKIKNGRIVFNNTRIEGPAIFSCEFEGSVSNDTVYTDWFFKGKKNAKKLFDLSQRVQAVFNLGSSHVLFGSGYYQFADVNIGNEVTVVGNETTVIPLVLEQNEYRFNFLRNVFSTQNARSITVINIVFKGITTGSILPGFKSDKIYGQPLIFVDKADKVVIDGCVFKDIENCTYCNKAYNYYGKKQGSCVCLWDVSDASFINCEQVGNRHDEQVWIIAVNKPIMETKVNYFSNFVHDMSPGPNSSAFTCVAGTCFLENNKVDRYSYPGSMFNVFAKKAIIKNNVITNSYCSSVFDVCEYSYFHNDDVLVEGNQVDAVNSVLVLGQSAKTTIKNNVFRGLGLYYSANNPRPDKETGGYQYWYSDREGALPVDAETVIDGNTCDFTAYDGNRSIAGATADYATGEILGTQSYNNVGVNYGCGILIHPNVAKAGSISITNNTFTSIQSLDGVVDKNNLANLYPYTIKLVNTESAVIRGNTFNGGYAIYGNPDEITCIGVYNYPDVMEKIERPSSISRKPSDYGKYVIEDNVFNVETSKTFYPFAVYARVNSSRQTPLTFKELVVRNNSFGGTLQTKTIMTRGMTGGTLYKQNGLVKVQKETLK